MGSWPLQNPQPELQGQAVGNGKFNLPFSPFPDFMAFPQTESHLLRKALNEAEKP